MKEIRGSGQIGAGARAELLVAVPAGNDNALAVLQAVAGDEANVTGVAVGN